MILNFWAGQCPPCRAEMSQFQAFHDDFKDEIMLLGVDIWILAGIDSHRDAELLPRELGITYPAG
jgi:thiol-disulfide isomerase/thioredoxin